MEKLIIIVWAYSKGNGACYSEEINVSSKEELKTALDEFEKSAEEEANITRFYMESTLSSMSRAATDEELKWLDEADIGFDGVNN